MGNRFRTSRRIQVGFLTLVGSSCCMSSRAASCFNETAPASCSSDGIEVNASLDVQNTCYIIDRDFVYDAPFDLDYSTKALSDIDADSEFCQQARQAYHLCYWCTPNITSDSYCFFRPDTCHQPPEVVDETVDIKATCDELNAFSERDDWPATIDLCYRAHQVTYLCPAICQSSAYLGADTARKRKAIQWVSRCAAMLSFCGACYIIWNVLSDRKNRSTVYHQLLCGMAAFDIVTAAAWSPATRPIPEDEGWYVDGAEGTWPRCMAQAFFVQLGFTSVFYNVSLASYYLLVIVYGWREDKLKRIRVYLHGGPLLVGLALALGGIPSYDWIEYGCHLEPPPWGALWEVLVFAVLPIGFSIVAVTLIMLIVYASVRRQSRVSRKWSLGFGNSSPLEKKVFWQAFLYSLSFYGTWSVLFSVYIDSADTELNRYGYTILVAYVGPIQGFNNFLVYVRPRVLNSEAAKRISTWVKGVGRRTESQTDERETERPTMVSSEEEVTETNGDPSVAISHRRLVVDPGEGLGGEVLEEHLGDELSGHLS